MRQRTCLTVSLEEEGSLEMALHSPIGQIPTFTTATVSWMGIYYLYNSYMNIQFIRYAVWFECHEDTGGEMRFRRRLSFHWDRDGWREGLPRKWFPPEGCLFSG